MLKYKNGNILITDFGSFPIEKINTITINDNSFSDIDSIGYYLFCEIEKITKIQLNSMSLFRFNNCKLHNLNSYAVKMYNNDILYRGYHYINDIGYTYDDWLVKSKIIKRKQKLKDIL